MTYEQCLQYLELIQSQGIKFGLENVRTLLSSLDEPHHGFPSVLVAGTNGKGSVCAMLTKILSLHGFRVGLYTSPHLVKIEERIRLADEPIFQDEFCEYLTFLKKKIEDLIASQRLLTPPTYFEILTCLAFYYFYQKKVDIAVLEVGMGGRFDATNVVMPLVSVITTISLEHQKYLGNTLFQIASEKAGIIKPFTPVVCGVEEPEAYQALKLRAEELKAPFFPVFPRSECLRAEKEETGYRFNYSWGEKEYEFSPSLQGEHQGKNACVAIVAAEMLNRNWRKLEEKKIVEGVENTYWPGRIEVLHKNPSVILDGAHNPQGTEALSKYIDDFIKPPIFIVFGCMKDKEIEKMVHHLFPRAEEIILTSFPFFRAASTEEIHRRVLNFKERIIEEPTPNKAFLRAMRRVGKKGTVIITGSLFLVGEAKKFFKNYFSF